MKESNSQTIRVVVSMGVLLFFLGIGGFTFARQEQRQDKVQQKQKLTPNQQENQQTNERRKQQSDQPSRQEQRVQQGEEKGIWLRYRAHSWQNEHRTWQQRGGYNGYRIPKDHFQGNFGRDHWFRIQGLSLEIFSGHPRFRYGGFWIGIIDTWPEYWSDGWYENDDVYIDYYRGGYYLHNRKYPWDRIAISVYRN